MLWKLDFSVIATRAITSAILAFAELGPELSVSFSPTPTTRVHQRAVVCLEHGRAAIKERERKGMKDSRRERLGEEEMKTRAMEMERNGRERLAGGGKRREQGLAAGGGRNREKGEVG